LSQRKWQIRKVNRGCLRQLAGGLRSPISVARVLMNRGIFTLNDAQKFLDPELSSLNNLRSIPCLREAVLLIDAVIKANGKILVFGDYDADGLTACCHSNICLSHAILSLKASAESLDFPSLYLQWAAIPYSAT